MIEKIENEVEMLDRHTSILRLVVEEEPIGIVALSNETGYPHHKVRYSLRVLEEEGIIEPTPQGAVPMERANEFLSEYNDQLEEVIGQFEELKTLPRG